MKAQKNIEASRAEVLEILKNPKNTHEQTMMALATLAENLLPYPDGTPEDFYSLYDKGIICDLDEGHAPYTARYILPDYDKLMKNGCKFLKLDLPKDLFEALNTLLIFYRHVPSITHFPVYMGNIDYLLEPFIQDTEEAKKMIRGFLIHCDRTFGSSFCHMNLGPKASRAGWIVLELESELKNSVPNMTLIYDPKITPDDFAELAIETALASANPAFAYKPAYDVDFKGRPFGIASCYNGLPIGGGAFTLSRLRLNKLANNSTSVSDFFDDTLPHAVRTLCQFMEEKTRFIVEETPFFSTHFLVNEGFIRQDNFVGLFGMAGLCECVNQLMKLQGKTERYGKDEEANQLGVKVMDALKEHVESFESKYSPDWDHHFMLHAQVGAAGDEGTSPGARIAIGEELPLYDHLRQAGLYHKYFPTGVGDIFPFDTTYSKNPAAILDVFKGAFKVGIRYISTYSSDSELVRVTGYLVKKSDIQAYAEGKQVINETVRGSYNAKEYDGTLRRKVRSI